MCDDRPAPCAAAHDLARPVLALSSTLAGNLLIVGSIANIIVVDHAARLGVATTGGRMRGSACP